MSGDEISGGASGIAVDRVGEVGNRASEEQSTWVYGASFYNWISGKVGVMGTWGLEIEVGSDMELTEMGRMAECGKRYGVFGGLRIVAEK